MLMKRYKLTANAVQTSFGDIISAQTHQIHFEKVYRWVVLHQMCVSTQVQCTGLFTNTIQPAPHQCLVTSESLYQAELHFLSSRNY